MAGGFMHSQRFWLNWPMKPWCGHKWTSQDKPGSARTRSGQDCATLFHLPGR